MSPGTRRETAPTLAASAALIAVAAAVVVAYLPSLPGLFVLDDLRNIVNNPTIRMTELGAEGVVRAARVPSHLSPQRPLSYVTFALDYLRAGLDPSAFRLTNILVLVASLPLAFLVIARAAAPWHPAAPPDGSPSRRPPCGLFPLSSPTASATSYSG